MKNSFILLLILIISACNQDNGGNSTQGKSVVDQNNDSNMSEEKILSANTGEAFDFTYKDLMGKDVSLSDFRGKWVIANFWATWCPPCRKEIPDFVKFKTLYADQAEILGINNEDAETEKIENFVFEYEINYPILRANVYNPSEFSKANTMGLPTTVIFNPEGQQVSKRVGPIHFKDLVKIVGINN